MYWKESIYGGNIILNVDIEKAFDKGEWDFLFEVLHRFGFSNPFIALISLCLSKESFGVLFKCVVKGSFFSSRGIKQGDPLSPFIFIITLEVLCRGISREFIKENVPFYHSSRMCDPITHLLYGDDTLLFLTGLIVLYKGYPKFLKKIL